MKWILAPLFMSGLLLLTACNSVPFPNEANYGISYRFQTDTERDIMDGGFSPEIQMYTNDWHLTVRTPAYTGSVASESIDDARDSWRVNGFEVGYGRPLWQTDPAFPAYAKFEWELNGGVLIAYEKRATENIVTVNTASGPLEYRERVTGATKYVPSAGLGLGFSVGVDTPGGGKYQSVGLGVYGGYRYVGEFGETPYVDVGLILGL